VNKKPSIKTGAACVFVVVLFSLSLGCAQSTRVPAGRQSHEFVDIENLLVKWFRDGSHIVLTKERLAIVGEFMDYLSEDDPRAYVLDGSFTNGGSVYAVIAAGSPADVYYLLEVSGEGRTRYFTDIPMF
jgi:hypothetical protein